MNTLRRVSFLSIAVLLVLLALPMHSHAVPGFSRQTGEKCNDCHTLPPKLNMDGMMFKLGGYTSRKNILSQDIGDGKSFLQYNPVSLRLLSYLYSKEKGNDEEVIFPHRE